MKTALHKQTANKACEGNTQVVWKEGMNWTTHSIIAPAGDVIESMRLNVILPPFITARWFACRRDPAGWVANEFITNCSVGVKEDYLLCKWGSRQWTRLRRKLRADAGDSWHPRRRKTDRSVLDTPSFFGFCMQLQGENDARTCKGNFQVAVEFPLHPQTFFLETLKYLMTRIIVLGKVAPGWIWVRVVLHELCLRVRSFSLCSGQRTLLDATQTTISSLPPPRAFGMKGVELWLADFFFSGQTRSVWSSVQLIITDM